MAGEIRVGVAGAAGRMGQEVVRAVAAAPDLLLADAWDRSHEGEDAGTVAGIAPAGVRIRQGSGASLQESRTHVLIDFTVAESAVGNIETALTAGVACVVGTTGIAAQDLERLGQLAESSGVGLLVAPNFAIGAVLMMEFAAQAARYLPDVEIIELHHEKKLDAPSGTAMLTARKIADARSQDPTGTPAGAVEKAAAARGATVEQVPVHSVRLPGHVAHQQVIFGGPGQTLTIRHDSLDRASFMPGVVLAVRKVRDLRGLVVGLEHLLQ